MTDRGPLETFCDTASGLPWNLIYTNIRHRLDTPDHPMAFFARIACSINKRSALAFSVIVVIVSLIASSERARDLIIFLESIPTITQTQKIVSVLGLGPSAKNPITFIDVDEATWNAWGREAQISRKRLASLLDAVGAGQPLAVMIDFDLSREHAEDAKLRASLDRLAERRPTIPVLVPREIVGPPGENLSQRATAFDGVKPLVWVSARFQTDEYFSVKTWTPYEIVCDAVSVAYLSPQLFMDGFVTEGTVDNKMQNSLNAEAKRRCGGGSYAVLPGLPSSEQRRFIFAFGNVPGPVAPLPEVEQNWGGNARRVPALFRMPAHRILERRIDSALVDSRVVIIGASHSDSGDVHLTPYGLMPGPMILANALALTKQSTGHDDLASEARTRLVLAVIVAALMTLGFKIFETLPFVLTVYLITIGVYAAVGHFSGPTLAADVTVDALSLFAAFAVVTSGLQVRTRWRQRGWRALLKEPKP